MPFDHNNDFVPTGERSRRSNRDIRRDFFESRFPQPEPSLGDILGHLLKENDKSKEEVITVEVKQTTPTYFQQVRRIVIDTKEKIERVKQYRTDHGCTLPEANHAVEVLMLTEMLDQAETMEDVQLIRDWAKYSIVHRLNRK